MKHKGYKDEGRGGKSKMVGPIRLSQSESTQPEESTAHPRALRQLLDSLSSVKLYDVDTVLVVVVLILAVALVGCCALYWGVCCCVRNAADKARAERKATEKEMKQEAASSRE